MIFKNSFYKKSILIIILVVAIFTAAILSIIGVFFNDVVKSNATVEFTYYERYVKSYFEEIKSDILSALNSSDLKNFITNKNNAEIEKYFSYYLKKSNAPESIYLLNNENKLILLIGESEKEDSILKFVENNKNQENVYVSDFTTDKYSNENSILFGKNLIIDNKCFKLVFLYNKNIFNNFFIDGNGEKFYSVFLPNGKSLIDFSKYEKSNKFISDMDFMELSKAIKIKTYNVNSNSNDIEDFVLEGENNDICISYKRILEPDLILAAIENNTNLFGKVFIYILIFVIIFLGIILALYSVRMFRFVSSIFKSQNEIKKLDLTIDHIHFTNTGIENIDLYINKIEELCERYKNILFDIKKLSVLFNTNIGIIEIIGKDGVVVFSSEIAEFVGAEVSSKINSTEKISVESFLKFKNSNWKPFKEEENVYYIETGNTLRWIKVLYYDENNTKALIVDISNYIVKKYKNTYDLDFDYVTGFIKKDIFFERVDGYINKNSLEFGCFVSLELNYYSTIYESYGEYISDEYLRNATAYFPSLFSGCFVGMKSKGEFMIFIYSENSKEDIKSKFEIWENKISSYYFTAPDGKKFKYKFTAGYACYPTDATDIDTLLKYSVFALYETKKLYKNTIHAFAIENYNRDMFIEIRTKALDKLIDENTANYHFQPIINIKDCSIYGYEMLLRVQDDIFSTPVDVVNLALTQGKAYLLEKMNVLNCMEIVKNNRAIFDTKRIFLNSIASNSLTEDDLRNIRSKYNLVRNSIVYEISTMFAENETVINKCEIFKKNDVKYAIDKFGGKYTDDISLLSTNPEFVKISRNLISDIHLKKENQSLVMKIVKFAKENNINVIAVGIETYDELATVIKMGIDFVQGYYIAFPKSEFEIKLRETLIEEINEIKSSAMYF